MTGNPSNLRRTIRFRSGRWWLVDACCGKTVRICGLFDATGWNVTELSLRLGLSRRSFDRIADEGLGISAKLWLRQLRAVRARHRLREGVQIKVVAAELGFRHQTDFTKEFKRMTGVTPTAFQTAEIRRNGFSEGT